MKFRYLLPVVAAAIAGWVIREGMQTLGQLKIVEHRRDLWQRPDEVIQDLNLGPRDGVEDVGSGAGYFSLKLARVVGSGGSVFAVDTRAESLAFLWIRAHREGLPAVRIVHGDAADPAMWSHTGLSGVLIANTYHELTMPDRILNSAFRALRPGGRLVILDRGPKSATDPAWAAGKSEHEVPSELVVRAVRAHGFDVSSIDDQFIDGEPEAGDHWWLIVARKPGPT